MARPKLGEDTERMSILITGEEAAILERHVAEMQAKIPGLRMSRSEAVRHLIRTSAMSTKPGIVEEPD